MIVLGFDTATPATAVAVRGPGGLALEARHDPAPGERPAHATALLPLAERVLAEAGLAWQDVERLGVGLGPGTFTGLRIGVATTRALAQAHGLPIAGVSTLAALAAPALRAHPGRTVLAVIDARRGEVFAAAYADGRTLLAPAALTPEALAHAVMELRDAPLAVGDGAVGWREHLEPAGAVVPPDGSPLHRVSALAVCELAGDAEPSGRDAVLPDYLRLPDAEIAYRRRHP